MFHRQEHEDPEKHSDWTPTPINRPALYGTGQEVA